MKKKPVFKQKCLPAVPSCGKKKTSTVCISLPKSETIQEIAENVLELKQSWESSEAPRTLGTTHYALTTVKKGVLSASAQFLLSWEKGVEGTLGF